MTSDQLQHLVEHLRSLPRETEWVEFKHNTADPQDIGEYLSALANGAALRRQRCGYLLWGVKDDTHTLVGTTFRPRATKKGNEELENWLLHQLAPRIDFAIHEGTVNGHRIVLLEIQPASIQPVAFGGIEYIRVGTYKKKLKAYPEKERSLWALFSEKPFETCAAASSVSSEEVLNLIDYASCFRMLGLPLPDNRSAVLERLVLEKIIVPEGNDRYDITNVGAILFAMDLGQFARLARKAPRVVIYSGSNRTQAIKEQVGIRGYAIGIAGLISYVNDQLPQNEQIDQALRRQVRMYPEIAIRELIANALIHQDFTLSGTGPMIELFSDRMEITNPGLPLIDTLRFIDEPPRSRNEAIASLMRRMNICEERGSGIDKVIASVELFQLPAPDFRAATQHTIAVLYGPRAFGEMDRQERVRACYQHACLMHVSGRQMTNASLRERLNIVKTNYPVASRIIRDAIDRDLIRPVAGIGKEHGYVPFWA